MAVNESAEQTFGLGENFWIAALIVAAVVGVAFIFRGSKMKRMKVKAGSIQAEMSTHTPPMQEIKGNVLKGRKNVIRTERGDTNIRDNTLDGNDQKIDVRNSSK